VIEDVDEVCIPYINIIAETMLRSYANDEGEIKNWTKRINELSNALEEYCIECLRDYHFIHCSRPLNEKGQIQLVGYPDLLVKVELEDGSVFPFYLEIKLYKDKSKSNTQRSLHLSTGKKIHHDCPHYALAFEHADNVLTGKVHIVDLYHKILKLKEEYNTSNKYLLGGDNEHDKSEILTKHSRKSE